MYPIHIKYVEGWMACYNPGGAGENIRGTKDYIAPNKKVQ